MRAALDEPSPVEHEDLIRAENRRETMRDDECRTSVPQRIQPFLDQRLALTVQARRRFVEQEDRWIGEKGSRDRDTLALSSRQLHATLADDGLIAVGHPLDELVAVRDARDAHDVGERRVGTRVTNVLEDRSVEE